MKHQLYFPSRQTDQLVWLKRFKEQLPKVSQILELPPEEVIDTQQDLDWLIHFIERVLIHVRGHAQAWTASLNHLMFGKDARAVTIPVLTEPPAPPSDIPPPGALKRVFRLVRIIKQRPGYTESIGNQLGVVGNLHLTDSPVPTFHLEVVAGRQRPAIQGTFRRFGRVGVYVETKRGEQDWEPLHLGLFTGSEFLDDRPLLQADVPEEREYRLRYWEDDHPAGEWSPVRRITVSP